MNELLLASRHWPNACTTLIGSGRWPVLNVPNLEVTLEQPTSPRSYRSMAVPTVLPTEATPLDFGHKRKHSQIIDLTGDEDDDDVATAIQQPTSKREDQPHQAESQQTEATTNSSGQAEDEEDEVIEQMLEQLEGAEPFIDSRCHISVCTTKEAR